MEVFILTRCGKYRFYIHFWLQLDQQLFYSFLSNIRNVHSDFSIVTVRRVAIIFFELGILKNFM